MEKASCYPVTLSSLLCSSLPIPWDKVGPNQLVRHSFKIWAQFRRTYNFKNPSLFGPIYRNVSFLPSICDNAFAVWQTLWACVHFRICTLMIFSPHLPSYRANIIYQLNIIFDTFKLETLLEKILPISLLNLCPL